MSNDFPRLQMPRINSKAVIYSVVAAFIFLLVIVATSNILGEAEGDEYVILQNKGTGNYTVISEPGYYNAFWSNEYRYKRVISINFTGDSNAMASEVIKPIDVRFFDTNSGNAVGVARFQLPAGEKLVKMHRDFGSQQALESNLLTVAVRDSAKSSARLMSVEQHYSGGNGQLSSNFEDQMRKGAYVVELITPTTTKAKVAPKKGSGVVEETLASKNRVQVRMKLDKDGNQMRNAALLAPYKIVVVSAKIEDVIYENKVQQRLDAQKKSAADQALSRQNLKRAEQEAQTAIAEGKREVAIAEAEALKAKKTKVVAAQTQAELRIIEASRKVEEAKQDRLVKVESLKGAKLEAQSLRVMASARKAAGKVAALDPKYVFDEHQKTLRLANEQKFDALGKHQLVPTYMGGGTGKGGPSGVMQMFEFNQAKQLIGIK